MTESMAHEVLETWIDLRINEEWPGAEYIGHEDRERGHHYHIRLRDRDYWLVVGHRAVRRVVAADLVRFLDGQRWLELLRINKCLRVSMPGSRTIFLHRLEDVVV